ncbi:thioredoxin family protein [Pedobacter nototheniae]|uniref:thioredoxin family protein n=1 Tax=Pedobacter nototheniae TaxID=2488994 RepID=UPI00292CC4AA|nr:thioredoxin fold domain-containing protein [Pedobacter nototheniae]
MKNLTYCAVLFGLFLLLNLFTSSVTAQTKTKGKIEKEKNQINFIENSLELVLKKAKSEHKYIFVDAYAVWCGPCKLLKATTFKDKKVADFFNTNFVNLSIDMEKGQGLMLAEKWGVEAYPTLIVLDTDGNIVFSKIGYIEAKELLELGYKVSEKNKS